MKRPELPLSTRIAEVKGPREKQVVSVWHSKDASFRSRVIALGVSCFRRYGSLF